MAIIETKTRSIIKTITWRLFAIINSWFMLSLTLTTSNLLNAIYMNITGFFIFYFFERVWSKINFGRHHENDNFYETK